MSILSDIKEVLDFATEEDEGFDSRLLLEIDSAIGELSQLVKLNQNFELSSESNFTEILPDNSDPNMLRLVKKFLELSVRINFDPPTGSVLSSLEKSLNSTAHRIIIQKKEYNE